jgi:hypothetical protein
VRALVRNVDKARDLPSGIERVPGDSWIRDLWSALSTARAVVTTATGYTDWTSPDSAVDSQGNRKPDLRRGTRSHPAIRVHKRAFGR